MKTCPDCNGDGVIEKGTDDEQQCPTCGGSGFVPDDDDDEEITRTASAGARPRVSSDRYCLLPSRCETAVWFNYVNGSPMRAVSAQAGIMVLIGIALYALTGVPPS